MKVLSFLIAATTIAVFLLGFWIGKDQRKHEWSDAELQEILTEYISVIVWSDGSNPTIYAYNDFTENEMSVECNFSEGDPCGNVWYYHVTE